VDNPNDIPVKSLTQICRQGSLMPPTHTASDEIDLREFFAALWQGKWWVIGSSFIAAVLAVTLALSLPDVYRAQITATPSENAQSGGLGLSGQMGGLASLAGVNLGGSKVDKSTIAIEILRSRKFIGDFISRHNLKVPLMASSGWVFSTNTLILDPSIYDATQNKWLRVVESPRTPEPTEWETTKKFLNEHLFIDEDQQSGILRISIEHYSPFLAAQWVSLLLQDLNDYMRQRDVSEAQASIQYLENQMATTNLSSMQEVFANIIEQQLQTLMLANVRDEYIFSTIDPATVPEERAKPSRALIAIAGTLLGSILGITIALVIYFWRNSRHS
jgi:uncharacterized protein involved in exopolysaccharide biosynthesis